MLNLKPNNPNTIPYETVMALQLTAERIYNPQQGVMPQDVAGDEPATMEKADPNWGAIG